jgi:hypothetical protein
MVQHMQLEADCLKIGVGMPASHSFAPKLSHPIQGKLCRARPPPTVPIIAKLSCILGILRTLANLLCTHEDSVKSGGISLKCDGLLALQLAFYEGPAVVTRQDFDLIHAIQHHL